MSVREPGGRELLGDSEAVSSEATFGVLNTIITCPPFPLNGVGEYRIGLIVNGIEDYSSILTIQQGVAE